MAHYEEISIDQGADIAIQLHLADQDGSVKDLTGYSFAAKLKRTYNSDSSDTTTFSISLQQEDGIATLALTNTQTDALKAEEYVYDVKMSFLDISLNTIIERVLEGVVTVNPSVTR